MCVETLAQAPDNSHVTDSILAREDTVGLLARSGTSAPTYMTPRRRRLKCSHHIQLQSEHYR